MRGYFFLLCLLLGFLHTSLGQASTTTNITESAPTLSNPVLQEHVDRWFAMINGVEEAYNETEYAARFSPLFVKQVPLADYLPIVEDLQAVSDSWRVVQIAVEQGSGAQLVFAPADTGEPLMALSIAADPTSGMVNGMFVGSAVPPELENPPTTFQQAVDRLNGLGHQFQYVVADVNGDEDPPQCSVLAGQNLTTSAPMGSMCKFWVLAAVVDAIESGTITWDQLVFLTEQDKSLPSGIVQDDPVGSNRTVRDLAGLMISISDNTATDLLVRLVGRDKVEAAQADYGHSNPQLNIPFITTKELFVLKLHEAQGDGQPGLLGQQYVEGDEAQRRAILAGLEDTTIESFQLDISAWAPGPIAIEELEWFGTPLDLCHVMARLAKDEEAARIMAMNPGVPDAQGLYSYIGFKGGSEPGVLGLSWYLVPNSNATNVGPRVVTGTLWDTGSVVDEATAVQLMGLLRDLSWMEEFPQNSDNADSANATEPATDPPSAEEDKDDETIESSSAASLLLKRGLPSVSFAVAALSQIL